MTLIEKIKELEGLFENEVQKAATVALPITQEIDKVLSSGQALVAESLIPNGVVYGAAVLSAIKALEPALAELSNKNSAIYTPDGVKGLLQRLGSEITAIVHGGKKPFGFYVKAFEIAFDS